MKRAIVILFSTVFILISAGAAFAAAKKWELDKAHSGFYFTIDHIFSKVRGHFNDFSTEVNFDPNDLAGSRFYFEVKTGSIDTNIGKRDKHLQSDDFFDSGKYPTMTFESTSITDDGNGAYNVAGKFNVKGQTYDLTLPLTLAGVKAHPAVKGKLVAGFNGSIVLDRLAYKIGKGKFYDMGVVGKDVDVLVTLELLGEK